MPILGEDMILIHQQVASLACADPDRIAAHDGARSISYGELQGMVERLRVFLMSQGVRKGQRVALLAPPSIEYLVTYLAVTAQGAIYVGLNPKHRLPEIDHVLRNSDPALVLARRKIRGRDHAQDLAALASRKMLKGGLHLYHDFNSFLDAQGCCGEKADPVELAYNDPCALIYTSGSTGSPKGALIPHGGLVECCKAQARIVGLSRPVVLNNLPVNHIGCIGDLSAFALTAGGSLVFQENFNPAEVLDLIERHAVSWWGQIPTMFQLALDEQDQQPRNLLSIQRIFTSGAPTPMPLLRRLRQICPQIQNGYGMTETVGSVCWVERGSDEEISETIGKPVEPYRARLADAAGKPVAMHTTGEIQVQGRMHMLGYWRDAQATADAYTLDGWLRTGDLAMERDDGNWKLVGRSKEAFKSGGYNVYPREIEKVLEGLKGVEIAVVVGVPDSLYHEVGYAFIQLAKDSESGIDEISRVLRRQLANYKIPKYFQRLVELPLLLNGKIDRKGLAEQARLAMSR